MDENNLIVRSAFLTVFLVSVSAAIALAAAKPGPVSARQRATPLVAAATIPQFPLLSKAGCENESACGGLTVLAKEMLRLVDADRLNPANDPETGGRALPLKWDPRLAEAALEHSQDMAAHHYFSHYAPNGNSPVERITIRGVQWRSIGENIAKNFTVAAAESAFMNEPRFEPNHRGNLLNPKFNAIGIGIVRGSDGMIYVTQDFAQE